jgi:hypothetical protein
VDDWTLVLGVVAVVAAVVVAVVGEVVVEPEEVEPAL